MSQKDSEPLNDQNNDKNSVNSPCIGLCALNDDGICIGCYRSLEEIAMWSSQDTKWRKRVLSKARERESGHDGNED